uniref:Uncharacterized protein n=1 Tax=Anopheles dirus TaxID=7168 RepID=A0A182NYC0_9DIPT
MCFFLLSLSLFHSLCLCLLKSPSLLLSKYRGTEEPRVCSGKTLNHE